MKGCCCFSLRTGGLVIACLTMFGGLIICLHPLGGKAYYSAGIIDILIGGLCFYGILYNRHTFLLPYLICSWLGLGFLLIFLLYIPIDWFSSGLFKTYIVASINSQYKDEKEHMLQIMGFLYVILWIFFAFVAVLGLYFTFVMQSLYKSIKDPSDEVLPTSQQNYNAEYVAETYKMMGCCCFSLRTCGLVLACSTMFGGLIICLHPLGGKAYYSAGIINILIGGLCFYGILYNRHTFMLPYLIFSWLGLGFLLILLLYIPIDWFSSGLLKTYIVASINPQNQDEKEHMLQIMGFVFVFAWIFYALVAVLELYFTFVMQLLYKFIKDPSQGVLRTSQLNYNAGYVAKTADF